MQKYLLIPTLIALSFISCSLIPTDQDQNGPASFIIYPADGTAVNDTVQIICALEKNNSAAKATFYLNDKIIGSSSTPPFSIIFDPYYHASGQSKLSVNVTDSSGHTGPSSGITVIISDTVDKNSCLLHPVYPDTLSASSNVHFEWKTIQNTGTYFIQISSDYEARHIVMSDSAVSTSTDIVFFDSGSYFWRIRGKSADGVIGDWSKPQRFYFGLLPPQLLSSPFYDSGEPCRIVISSSDDPVKYEYLLSHDTLFSDTVYHVITGDTVIDCGTLRDGPYYLKIRTVYYSGVFGSWSCNHGIGINVFTRSIPLELSISTVKAVLYAGNSIAILAGKYSAATDKLSYLMLLDSNGILKSVEDIQKSTVSSAYPLSIITTRDSGFIFSVATMEEDSTLQLVRKTHLISYGSNGIRSSDTTMIGKWSSFIQLGSGDFLTTWKDEYSGINVEKYDPHFNLVWKNAYGHEAFGTIRFGELVKIWQSSNTAIHLLTNDRDLGDKYQLVIDTSGSVIDKILFEDNNFSTSAIVVEDNSGIASIGKSGMLYSFLQFDGEGRIVSRSELPDSQMYECACIYHTNDGNYISVSVGTQKIHTCIFNQSGLIINRADIAAPGRFALQQVLQSVSGRLVIIGLQSDYTGLPPRLVVIKTDRNGKGVNIDYVHN